jgi:hypothetical protein
MRSMRLTNPCPYLSSSTLILTMLGITKYVAVWVKGGVSGLCGKLSTGEAQRGNNISSLRLHIVAARYVAVMTNLFLLGLASWDTTLCALYCRIC